MKNEIRDSAYNLLGWTTQEGDKIRIYDSAGMNLGYFVISENKTYKAGGTCIGTGNLLALLLPPRR